MQCDELLAALNEYVDGGLDPGLCAAFEDHLKGCNPCQIVIDNVRHTIQLYKGDEPYELRAEFQEHMEGHGIDTRMVWTGNVTRQPAFAGVPHRVPEGGLPNADRVMETGLVLPCNHAMSDADVDYVCETIGAFLDGRNHAA